jgi:hypothetical protein
MRETSSSSGGFPLHISTSYMFVSPSVVVFSIFCDNFSNPFMKASITLYSTRETCPCVRKRATGVHKVWCMYVFPNVLLVPSSHGLSPNHPHHTCSKLCRRPSKSYKMSAEAEGCEKCPLATRPHVHKMCVSPNVLVVPSLHAFFTNHTHHTCARPCRRPSMS